MPAPDVTNTARHRPGKCAISGDTQGPFIDTKRDIPRFGRIYLSLSHLDNVLRKNGYLKQEDVEEIREQNGQYQAEIQRLTDIELDFNSLREIMKDYIPDPEPEVIEREVKVPRAPTDEEIEEWIKTRGGDHEAVRTAKAPEKGSSEEWFSIYGDPREQQKTSSPVEKAAPGTTALERESEDENDDGPPKVVEFYEQNVDLDKILSENVGTIAEFLDGKPEDFVEAVVRREFYLAEMMEREPRKGVLSPFGYWGEDGALHPDEFEVEETDEGTLELDEEE